MKVGSLFTGYGGLDLAVGGTLAWYAEVEPAACRVLVAHHPDTPNLGDVTRINWATVPRVDVLTAGYPCQPFSHAGKRKGTNDERHLWPYVRDAIRVLRPRITVLENVRGHLTLGFDTVLADLAELGMSARWGVVRAADAGAPHGRARLFIVVTDADGQGLQGRRSGPADARRSGPRGTAASDCGELPADTYGSGRPEDVEQPSDVCTTTREGQPSLADRHRADGDAAAGPAALAAADAGGGPFSRLAAAGHGLSVAAERGDLAAADAAGAVGEQRRRFAGPGEAESGGSDFSTAADAYRPSSEARGDTGHDGQRVRVEPVGLADVDWGKYAPAIDRWERVLDRPAPSPTIPGANGRPRLSPAFVEWMMGLPAGHVTGHGLSNAQALKMLGNGVCPQQARLALDLLAVA